MVSVVEDVGVVDVVSGEHGVALAEVALAGAGLVSTDGITVLVAITVLKFGFRAKLDKLHLKIELVCFDDLFSLNSNLA